MLTKPRPSVWATGNATPPNLDDFRRMTADHPGLTAGTTPPKTPAKTEEPKKVKARILSEAEEVANPETNALLDAERDAYAAISAMNIKIAPVKGPDGRWTYTKKQAAKIKDIGLVLKKAGETMIQQASKLK